MDFSIRDVPVTVKTVRKALEMHDGPSRQILDLLLRVEDDDELGRLVGEYSERETEAVEAWEKVRQHVLYGPEI